MKNIFTILALVLVTSSIFAQIGINNENPDASAALDITSTTGGLLVPRMTAAQRDAITSATQGLIIFCSDCALGEGELQIKLTSSWKSTIGGDVNDPANLVVGGIYGDGVIFYIFEDGDTGYVLGETHGLVAAMSDYPTYLEWGCFGTDLPNVPNVTSYPPIGVGAEIGDGFNNTNAILQDCPSAPAAVAARSLGPDWFLPSAKELNQMYLKKEILEAVSGFTAFSDDYWSSTEISDDFPWLQNFYNGNQYSIEKNFTFPNVRAVRAF
tara:strand:+ start:99 stop:902 length:804 start_codon:yes stop_codon:yes gene_type:complete